MHSGKIKKPTITLHYQWILTSRGRIFAELIIKVFKKYCMYSAMDGTKESSEVREGEGCI